MADLLPPPPRAPLAVPSPALDWSRLDDGARETVREYAYAANTLHAYGRAWGRWEAWARARGSPSVPADPHEVANYLDALGREGKSASTIQVAAAAISRFHILAGQPYDSKHAALRTVLRALRRKIGMAPARQAEPIVPHVIERMLAPLGSRLIDLRDRALVLVGFGAALRRSELVALDVADLCFAPRGLDVWIRSSKTDQEKRGELLAIPRSRRREHDASEAVRAWLEASGIEDGPAFRSVRANGTLRDGPLGARAVSLILKARAGRVGLDTSRLSGHSLRAGFITSAAVKGAPLDGIMRQARQKTPAVTLGYIRRATIYDGNAAEGLLD